MLSCKRYFVSTYYLYACIEYPSLQLILLKQAIRPSVKLSCLVKLSNSADRLVKENDSSISVAATLSRFWVRLMVKGTIKWNLNVK